MTKPAFHYRSVDQFKMLPLQLISDIARGHGVVAASDSDSNGKA